MRAVGKVTERGHFCRQSLTRTRMPLHGTAAFVSVVVYGAGNGVEFENWCSHEHFAERLRRRRPRCEAPLYWLIPGLLL
jgi:hypothetical protein